MAASFTVTIIDLNTIDYIIPFGSVVIIKDNLGIV